MFFKDLHEVNPKAAILSIVPGYCNSFNPTSQSSLLPPLMSSYYKPECISHAFNDLILESQILFQSLVVTDEQAQCLDEKQESKVSLNCGTDFGLEELQLQRLSKLPDVTH